MLHEKVLPVFDKNKDGEVNIDEFYNIFEHLDDVLTRSLAKPGSEPKPPPLSSHEPQALNYYHLQEVKELGFGPILYSNLRQHTANIRQRFSDNS